MTSKEIELYGTHMTPTTIDRMGGSDKHDQAGLCMAYTSKSRFCYQPKKAGSRFCSHHQPRKILTDEEQCQGTAGDWKYGTSRQCVQRREPGQQYCKMHMPGYVTPRTRKAFARYDAEWAEQKKNDDALSAAWDALRKIAAGHNDPRTLALETLEMPGVPKPPATER